MEPKVWTTRRKALGNLIPALVWLPPVIAGLWIMVDSDQMLGKGIWFIVGGNFLGWLTLDSFGLFENSKMRESLKQLLTLHGEAPAELSPFVGFSTPKYRGILDAHEDVGFLQFLPDRLLFVSETRKVEFLRSDMRAVKFRANIHTSVGLGRWIAIEGVSAGKPIRMLIESRDRPTMLGNLRASVALKARIIQWGIGRG